MNMSLDDIIKASKLKQEGGKRGRRRFRTIHQRYRFRETSRPNAKGGVIRRKRRGEISRATYARGDIKSALKQDLFGDYGSRKSSDVVNSLRETTTQLMILNLDFGVSDLDIQDLFSEFGRIKSSAVHYDKSGRSLGIADVVFDRRVDAIKAMKQYNGVPLDGRTMNIQLMTQEILSVMRFGCSEAADKKFSQDTGDKKFSQGGRGQPQQKKKKSRPTVEELNAELDAYSKQKK